MAKKEKLLNLVTEAVKREEEFVVGLTTAEREAVGTSDNWSAKDLVAHCAYWKKRRVSELPDALQGEPPEVIDDFDHENDLLFREYHDKSWDEVTALSQEASHLLINQLQQMSEEDLERPWQNDRPIWRMIVIYCYSHTMIHLAEHYQQKGDMVRADELTALLGQPLAELTDSPGW